MNPWEILGWILVAIFALLFVAVLGRLIQQCVVGIIIARQHHREHLAYKHLEDK